jgi:catechol 2,3-dioxygenase-like lactoylglutathione lyase family enzyme
MTVAEKGDELMEALEFRFAFFARDFEKSIHFYRDILGMVPTGEWWDRPDGKGALLSAGGTAVIEIYGAARGKTYKGPAPAAINLALRFENVSAVDDFHKRLASLGTDALIRAGQLEPPQDRQWGHRSFILHDPDGIPVHIYCELNPHDRKKYTR